MKRIDQFLADNPFKVDSLACQASAAIIRPYRGDEFFAPWTSLPTPTQLLFKLSFISICHQINWDFLQSRLAHNLLADDGENLLEIITNVSAKDIGKWLSEYDKPERIKGAERASLLRNLGKTIEVELQGDPMKLFVDSEGQIVGPSGFLNQLDRFTAYSEDPLRKKSNVLLQELTREKILEFKDINSISPAIDYHIMRLYLRTGRVIPMNLETKNILKESIEIRGRFVKLLREKVSEALNLTAFYANLPVSEVNYIEWQIGRSICKVEQPGCVTTYRDPTLDETVGRLFEGCCPYTNFCQAFTDPEWRQLKEPELKKSFY